jgi:hypothetical protein
MTTLDLKTGSQIILDWLGAGGNTVSDEHAQIRADVCTGRRSGVPCSHNAPSGILQTAAGESIRQLLEIKNHAKKRVDGEKSLHTCNACNCYLRLKVWVPIEHIVKHMSAGEMEKFPAWCWQRKESKLE